MPTTPANQVLATPPPAHARLRELLAETGLPQAHQTWFSEFLISLEGGNPVIHYGDTAANIEDWIAVAEQLELPPSDDWKLLQACVGPFREVLRKNPHTFARWSRTGRMTPVLSVRTWPLLGALLCNERGDLYALITQWRALLVSAHLLDPQVGSHLLKLAADRVRLAATSTDTGDDHARVLIAAGQIPDDTDALGLFLHRLRNIAEARGETNVTRNTASVLHRFCVAITGTDNKALRKQASSPHQRELGLKQTDGTAPTGRLRRSKGTQRLSADTAAASVVFEPSEQMFDWSETGLSVEATRLHRRYARQHQPLVWDRQGLNPLEADALACELDALRLQSDSASRTRACIGYLIDATGRKAREALTLTYGQYGSITPDGVWHREVPIQDRAAKLTQDVVQQCEPHIGELSLPLPRVLRDLLGELLPRADNRPLGEQLRLTPESAAAHMLQVLEALRRKGWRDVTEARIAGSLFARVYQFSADPVRAYLIAGEDNDAPVGAVYTGIPARDLEDTYATLHDVPVGQYMATGGWVGSRLVPAFDALNEHVVALRQRVQAALDGTDWVVAHNLYTAWVALVLLMGTGARPVIDLYGGIGELDEAAGLGLVHDKAVTDAHGWRLVPLATTVRAQIKAYRDHLRGLTKHLGQAGREGLAAEVTILATCTANAPAPQIPFLFLLDTNLDHTLSLSPGRLIELLGADWPWPLNVGRHFLSSRLREGGVSACDVNVILGHLDAFRQNFGKEATEAVADVMLRLAGAIEPLLTRAGFTCCPGFAAPYRQPRYRRTASRLHENSLIGEQRRRDARESRSGSDRAILRELFGEDPVRTIERDADAPMRILEGVEIASNDEPDRLARRLALCHRYFQHLKRRGARFRVPARCGVSLPEPSPFGANALREYRQAGAARSLLEEHCNGLPSAGTVSHAQRIALLCASAVLFDGLCRVDALQVLPNSVATAARHDDDVWVDLCTEPDSDRVTVRWHPGPLSRILLAGCLGRGDGLVTDRHDAETALVALLQLLGVTTTRGKAFAALVRLGRGAWRIELPGFLRAIAFGRTTHTPLSGTAYRRLVTGLRVLAPDSSASTKVEAAVDMESWAPRADRRGTRQRWKQKFLAEMRSCLRVARWVGPSGHARRGFSRCARFASLLRKTFGNQSLPPIAAAVVGWAYHLATTGSAYQRLKFPSVEAYIYAIMRPLLEIAGDRDLARMPEGDLELLYEAVREYFQEKNVTFRCGRLRDFHHYLVQHEGAAQIDHSIFGGESGGRRYSNANIVTAREYELARNTLHSLAELDNHYRDYLDTLLILGYRAGLRIDEAIQLQPRDFLRNMNGAIAAVSIRPGIFDDLKSKASRRTVPATREWTESERRHIERLIALAEERARDDPQALLLAQGRGPRAELDLFQVWQILHTLLRAVTGDPTIVFHHLRHSAVNRLIAQGFEANTCEYDSVSMRTLLVGNSENRSELLAAVACWIGHADSGTTTGSYWHLADVLIAQHTVHSVSHLRPRSISTMAGISYDALRQRLSRAAIAVADIESAISKVLPLPNECMAGYASSQHPEHHSVVIATAGNEIFGLPDLDRALAYVRRTRRPDQLGERFLLRAEVSRRLIDVARQKEFSSGYSRFQIINETGSAEEDREFEREAVAVRSLLANWQMTIEKMGQEECESLDRALASWLNAYHPLGMYLFVDAQALAAFLAGVDLLRLHTYGLEALVPEEFDPLPPEFQEILGAYAVPLRPAHRLPHFLTKMPEFRSRRVGLRPRSQGPLPYSRRLSRAFFVLSVWRAHVQPTPAGCAAHPHEGAVDPADTGQSTPFQLQEPQLSPRQQQQYRVSTP